MATTPVRLLTAPIDSRILILRGQKVLLDADLAALYRVSTRATEPGVETQPTPLSEGLRLSAFRFGTRDLEITIGDFKIAPWWTAVGSVGVHRARCNHGRLCPQHAKGH